MGEYAEMMLDGTMCAGCGEYMGDGEGFPGYCSKECAQDAGGYFFDDQPEFPQKVSAVCCPICGKNKRGVVGVTDHMRDKHGLLKNECEAALSKACGEQVKS